MTFQPTSRSEYAPRAVVALETSAGSGLFVPDARLRVERVDTSALGPRARRDGCRRCGADERPELGRACIAVRLDDHFDAVDARDAYHPDRRIIVRLEPPPPQAAVVLFDGYAVSQGFRPGNDAEAAYVLECRQVAERLRSEAGAQVLGRHVRDGQILDGLSADPAAWAARSVCATALSCVFNPGGRPNCDPVPLTIDGGGGKTRSIHIFTWDGDPNAAPWTAARALRYLFHFHAPRDVPVDIELLLDATDEWAADAGEGRAAWRDVDPLRYDLLADPASLDVDGRDLLDAMQRLARAAGLLLWCDSTGSPSDSEPSGVTTSWRVSSYRAAAATRLPLARGGRDDSGQPHYVAAGRDVRDILADNQITRGEFTSDDGAAAAPWVIGGVKTYEVTVPMSPGWLPAANLDNVAAPDRPAAKALALTPDQVVSLSGNPNSNDWYRRHHACGAEFPANRDVSRAWVLNEDGGYPAALYNRNAPFDQYAPYRFDVLLAGADRAPELWMRRPRRLLPLLAEAARMGSHGVHVEISFDSGASWFPLLRGYQLLAGRCGIWLDVENTLAVTPPNAAPATQNLWYALIDQMFRMRITAVIESDERLHAAPSSGGRARSLRSRLRILDRSDRFGLAARTASASAMAAMDPVGLGDGVRDDSLMASRFAAEAAERLAGSSMNASPFIPWIVAEYAVGDRIDRIQGRGAPFDSQRSPSTRTPVVVGKSYHFGPQRFGTELRLSVDNECTT